jgi:hypothetical protein
VKELCQRIPETKLLKFQKIDNCRRKIKRMKASICGYFEYTEESHGWL